MASVPAADDRRSDLWGAASLASARRAVSQASPRSPGAVRLASEAWQRARCGRRHLRARHHAAVAPLAIHYLRLGRRPCSLTVTFSDGRAAAGVALVYQWESDVAGYASALRQITGRASSGGKRLTFSVPIALARSPRFATPLLVVSNGGASGHLAYSVAVR